MHSCSTIVIAIAITTWKLMNQEASINKSINQRINHLYIIYHISHDRQNAMLKTV